MLQTYGYMDGGAVYVAAVCHHSELSALSYSTVIMVAGVYLFSILIAMIFSYIAIWIVLKPIQKLQEDITDQKPGGGSILRKAGLWRLTGSTRP